MFVTPFGLRVYGCCADTAGNEENVPLRCIIGSDVAQLRSVPEGTNDGEQMLSGVHFGELGCGVAHHLINDGDGTAFGVDVTNREGNTLAFFVRDYDDKLTGKS